MNQLRNSRSFPSWSLASPSPGPDPAGQEGGTATGRAARLLRQVGLLIWGLPLCGMLAPVAAHAAGPYATGGIQDARLVLVSDRPTVYFPPYYDGTDMYMSNTLIEVGARANGSYGTGYDPNNNYSYNCAAYRVPDGYHQRTDASCSRGIGFRAVNPIDLSWDPTQLTYGDFFVPGAPLESFAVGIGTSSYWNNSVKTQISGSWTSANYTSGVGPTATWTGTAGAVAVSSVSTIPEGDYRLHTDVTLTNTSGTDVGPVYYYRGIDPDNCAAQDPAVPGCAAAGTQQSFYTYNTIEYSQHASRGSRVSAWQNDGSYIALLTSEPNSKAILGYYEDYCQGWVWGFGDFSPVWKIWDGTNGCIWPTDDYDAGGHFGYPGKNFDNDIGIVIKIDSIPAGQSKTIRVTYLMLAPPPAPASITATANGSSRIDVAWTAPAPRKYAPITGYEVQYSTSATGPWSDAPGTCAYATTNGSTEVTCSATGLASGTKYYFRVAPINASGTGAFIDPANATTQAPVNGDCGSANGTTVASKPSQNLCNAGQASVVTEPQTGLWSWSCLGSNGGTTQMCSAGTSGGIGDAPRIELTEAAGCTLNSVILTPPPAGGPANQVMPYGVVDFKLGACQGNPATVQVKLTYSGSVAGHTLWKYGLYPNPSTGTLQWYAMPDATVNGNTITYSITDNGIGDSDPAVGAIADPAGPGYPQAPPPTDIPTLSEWAQILTMLLLMLMAGGYLRMRSRI